MTTTAVADAPKPVTDVCKELGGKCTAGAKLATKLGTARVYRVDGDDTRIALAIDTGKQVLLAPVFDGWKSECAALKCKVLDSATSKLTAVMINGKDAVVLEIATTNRYTIGAPSPGMKRSESKYTTATFIVCGADSCTRTTVGDYDMPCTASLAKTGVVTKTCTEIEQLTFD